MDEDKLEMTKHMDEDKLEMTKAFYSNVPDPVIEEIYEEYETTDHLVEIALKFLDDSLSGGLNKYIKHDKVNKKIEIPDYDDGALEDGGWNEYKRIFTEYWCKDERCMGFREQDIEDIFDSLHEKMKSYS